jgi:hypothetical protein
MHPSVVTTTGLGWYRMSIRYSPSVINAYKNLALRRPQGDMTLFPAHEPLDYVAIDILGPLPRIKKGNQYLLVIADRFSKPVRTVPLSRITAAIIPWAFRSQWVYLYGPLGNYSQTMGGNSPQHSLKLVVKPWACNASLPQLIIPRPMARSSDSITLY